MMSAKRILLVFAHPDDETFATGITIAKYHNEHQAEITLLCATRGQAGKPGEPPLCTQDELPFFREGELLNAARLLGINKVQLLDYEDKHLSDVPRAELAAHIVSAIQTTKPQVVITFASHGISGHPDHKAISAATDEAVSSIPAGDNSVRKLYHVTRSSALPTPAGRQIFTDSPEAITTEITSADAAVVVGEALRAHKTQHLSVNAVFPGVLEGDTRNVPITNSYLLKWTNIPEYTLNGKEDDLFTGIE
ncbi:PIG-L deacetylase family protein [Brevibacillus fluminis]